MTLANGLLLLPLELRQSIYDFLLPESIHFHIHNHTLHLSPCLIPTCDNILDDRDISADAVPNGHERGRNTDGTSINDKKLWAQRLRSTWGPHWNCEEQALQAINDGHGGISNLLHVCQKIRLELLDHIPRTSVLHFTDLERFDTKQQVPLLKVLLSQATRLSMTLRLPLFNYAYSAIARVTNEKAWSAVCLLDKPPSVKSLHIWLDHTGPQEWSCISERDVFEQILWYLSALQKRDIDVSITLPKLHPMHQNPERHYITPPPGIHVHRVLRQRWHGLADGEVEYSPDFPLLIDIDRYKKMPMGEVEEKERALRAKGVDVDGAVILATYVMSETGIPESNLREIEASLKDMGI